MNEAHRLACVLLRISAPCGWEPGAKREGPTAGGVEAATGARQGLTGHKVVSGGTRSLYVVLLSVGGNQLRNCVCSDRNCRCNTVRIIWPETGDYINNWCGTCTTICSISSKDGTAKRPSTTRLSTQQGHPTILPFTLSYPTLPPASYKKKNLQDSQSSYESCVYDHHQAPTCDAIHNTYYCCTCGSTDIAPTTV